MFNMRIDIIRKELEWRFKEVEELEGQDEVVINKAADRFVHFLLTEPDIKPFILELANFDKSFLNSDEYHQIVNSSIDSIKNIITEIDRANFIDQEFKTKFEKRFGFLGNFFELPDPDINNRYMSVDQFLNTLRNADENRNLILNSIEGAKDTILNIFEIVGNISDLCNQDLINKSYGQLDSCINAGIAHVKYKAQYIGADSLQNLLLPYALSYYRYLSNLDLQALSSSLKERRMNMQLFGEQTSGLSDYIDDCRQVYYAVDKYLMTGKSKSALIERLKTYCMWIKLEEFWEEGIKEEDISKIIEEYIFNLGYYPIVNPRAGRSIYDILAEPGENLRWDNSILIELKQYIREKDQESEIRRELPNDIGQAAGYYDLVKDIKRDVADTVHLLVFYNGKKRYYLGESYPVEKNVVVEFVYVGKETPSTLKSVSIDEK